MFFSVQGLVPETPVDLFVSQFGLICFSVTLFGTGLFSITKMSFGRSLEEFHRRNYAVRTPLNEVS